MSIPFPDPIVIALLSDHPALADLENRVSVVLASNLPAARITKVGDHEEPSRWEATPLYQVEIWDEDELNAGRIAWDLYNGWPHVGREVVLDALVHGRWSETYPFPSPDPATELPRYILTVGLRLSGVTT